MRYHKPLSTFERIGIAYFIIGGIIALVVLLLKIIVLIRYLQSGGKLGQFGFSGWWRYTNWSITGVWLLWPLEVFEFARWCYKELPQLIREKAERKTTDNSTDNSIVPAVDPADRLLIKCCGGKHPNSRSKS